MATNELREYDQFLQRLNRAYGKLPNKAATIAVNFVKERFKAQNWVDTSTEPWKKRKYNRGSKRRQKRAILVDKARLLRSWRKIQVTETKAVIGTDVPYARIHNEGGRFKGTVNIPQHGRKAFSRVRAGRREQVRAGTVKAHSRKMHWRMPKRQMIGNSAVLDRRIQRMITADINAVLKTL